MPKNIVLLSDGTGNSASKLFKTNVWRLYQALDLSDPDSQIAYFDDGVGTASFKPLALFGGAFGWGLKRNVLDLYTFLCRHYEEGDRIYGFGFSRGAFTIRVLTGLIGNQGLVKANTESEIRQLAADAFRAYRKARYHGIFITTIFRHIRDGLLWLWYKATGRKNYESEKVNNREAEIEFLGLWDTVAAYGLPFDELTRAWDFIFPLSFPDCNLSKSVKRACHALAIDDERHSFHPELWNENQNDMNYKKDYEENPDLAPLEKRLTQVWFAGMHTNVGGGYPDDAMAHVPLNWIMDEVEDIQFKLIFKPDEHDRLRAAADVGGRIYDSRRGLGGAYRYLPRKIKDITCNDDKKSPILIKNPKIHESVFTRIKKRVDYYAPIGLPDNYVVFTKDREIVEPSDSPKETPPVESLTRAQKRVTEQENIWKLVRSKRIVYFATVAVVMLLAAFPLYPSETHSWETKLSFLSPVISGISALLPGFLSTWFKAYDNHPGLFILVTLLLIITITIGNSLQRKIFDRMRIRWNESFPQKPSAEEKRIKPTSDVSKDKISAGVISSSPTS